MYSKAHIPLQKKNRNEEIIKKKPVKIKTEPIC